MPRRTQDSAMSQNVSDTRLSRSSTLLPRSFSYILIYCLLNIAVLQPHFTWFGLLPVRSPLLGESLLISVPGLLRWFTSPSVTSAAYFIQLFGFQFCWRVTPFGYLRVNGYVLLTAAFRSLSRPSSPYSSQASTIDLYLLDHIIYFIFRPYACCIFQAKISSLGLFLQRYSLKVSFPYMFPSLFFFKELSGE